MYKRQGTIAAVHYVGMLAYRIDGIIHWRSDLLIASIVLACLLYTSDAADERSSVDLGGRRIIKKKKKDENL